MGTRGRVALVIGLVAVVGVAVTAWLRDRNAPTPRLVDEAAVIPHDDVPRFEDYLRNIFRESDVDIRIVFVRDVGSQPIEEVAVKRVAALGIGRASGRERGTLLLYDVAGQRLRVEVGYGLEEHFPDAFVGYLMSDHVRAFFGGGDVSTGLRLTLRMLHDRIRSAILRTAFDPGVLTAIRRGRGHLSGGAGASKEMPLGRDPGGFIRAKLDADARARFRPQPTPEGTYERYLEWLVDGRFDPELPLFTPGSRSHVSRLTMTRAYMDYLLLSEYGRRFKADTRGDLALLYFTNDPLVSPHFFRRTPEGWQMDIAAEVRNSRNLVGFAYAWDWRGDGDEFSRAFAHKLVRIAAHVRIADGDNRQLRAVQSAP